MTIKLKQSTASQEIPLGYFVDSTDGNTEETALSIANTDIKLWKMGATTLANKNSGGGTHISNGIYYATLDATDTNTLGALIVFVHVSGALPVRVECEVLTAVNYDALVAGTDLLDVSTTQFNGTAVTASAGRPEVNTTHAAGTAWGSGAITAASIAASAIADTKIATGAITAAKFAAGAIDAAALATDAVTEIQSGLATAAALTVVDDLLDTEIGALTTNLATANAALVTIDGIVDSILVDTAEIGAAGAGLTALATAANLATVAGYLDTEIAAILADTNELQTDWANGGRLDLILDARASQTSVDTVDGIVDAILLDTAEIGAAGAGLTALATAAALTTVDTVVDAIKVTTDKLDTAVELDVAVYRFTTNALEQAPTGGSAPSAADIADAVWDEALAGHAGAGSAGKALSDVLLDTAEIGAAGAGLTVLATQASVTAIDDLVDTEVAAIKTVVDAIEADTQDIQSRIPAALVGGRIDANIGAVNSVVVDGAGTTGDPWGPV